MERLPGGLEAEEHGGIVAQTVVGYRAGLFYLLAEAGQQLGIVGDVVTGELGQWGTLARAGVLAVGHRDEPDVTVGVDASAGAGGLLEVERALRQINFYRHSNRLKT